MFSWIPIHREVIHRILEDRQDEKELLTILRQMEQQGLKVISLQDKGADGQNIPLAEIDPFTFLASFNRGVTDKNRRENWHFVKTQWGLNAPMPDDFTGIPTLNNMSSWLFPYANHREKDHVGLLWRVASLAADGDVEKVEEDLFDRCLELKKVGIASLTIGLFWINPEKFLPADHKTTAYGKAKGITTKPENYQSYRQWLREMTERLGHEYPQISHAAHLFAVGAAPEVTPVEPSCRYWTMSAGRGGKYWEEFWKESIIAIGWNVPPDPDLRLFKSKEDIRQRLQELEPDGSSKKNDALAFWQFVHEIRKGDVIFAKHGLTRLLGYGVVESDYDFDPERTHYKHIRRVKWLARGEWDLPEEGTKMALKTLTDITPYPDFVELIAGKVGLEMGLEPKPGDVTPPAGIAYWWLNANPKIWNFEETPVGQKQTYTSHNEKGNKRQKYRYFQEVKTGDLVIGYVTSPPKEVVAVCKITRGLHQTENGEEIEFEKLEQLAKPIAYETLQANPDLTNCEPIINNQGSLFKLTEQEYEVIRSLIDETNITVTTEIEPYDKKKAMRGLFLAETQFDEMLDALKEKKNVVLQGAPGVGKTYVARRLAYALIGANDPQRIEMIQFHQSYSYEDFIQGFRPTPKGHFDLKCGIFHHFCRRAQREEAQGKPYVFIIDEINRGNLSKIFGELMMLIEPDKRGKEHAIPLAYCQDADEKFYIPENLHLVGMMNTADRSLAMVDYALRRRFRFITLQPEFGSASFFDFLVAAGAKPELVRMTVARMNALNEVIAADTKNLGPGYQIGHSYFCPCPGIKPDEDWYRRVIESEIVPLIQEYWFDNEQKVKEQRSVLLAGVRA
jgi:5-methylcytosine-specific restriction protein B